MKSLENINPSTYVHTICQCLKENVLENNHLTIATPVSNNLVELAIKTRKKSNISTTIMYITNASYFSSNTMQFLINEILFTYEEKVIQSYYDILYRNFTTHPPCANYMENEYEQLFLTSNSSYFRGFTLWDYLMKCFIRIAKGSILYGSGNTCDLAFKRCLSFCVTVLEMNYEVTKHTKTIPIIIKCLKYNPERKTRMYQLNKSLDILYDIQYDFQVSLCNLMILIKKMTLDF